jgi:hypothetical protein
MFFRPDSVTSSTNQQKPDHDETGPRQAKGRIDDPAFAMYGTIASREHSRQHICREPPAAKRQAAAAFFGAKRP